MNANFPPLTLIGAGHMAAHLLNGLKRAGFPLERVWVTDPHTQKRDQFAQQFGVQTSADNHAAIARAAIVILAIKPQSLPAFALATRAAFAHAPLVISIAAGIPVERLQLLLGDAVHIVRAMPNICVSVAKGNTILFAPQVSVDQRALAQAIFVELGLTQWVDDEKLFDAYTVLTGSGPGYVFFILQSIIDAAHALGIPADDAKKAALQLFSGAAALASESEASLQQLQAQVTSKKGVTEQLLATLSAGELEPLLVSAFKNAAAHGQKLQHLQ